MYFLPAPVVIGHAFLAQTFFCLALALALCTSPAWELEGQPLPPETFPAFRHLCAAFTGAVFLQLLLGASVRHNVLGVIHHLLGDGIVGITIGWVIFRAAAQQAAQPALWSLSLAAGILLVFQLGLGIGSYFLLLAAQGAPQPEAAVIWVTTAHVAVGALLLGIGWILTLLSYRRSRISATAPSFVESPQKSFA